VSCGGPLSAVMSIAGAGMLPGAGAVAGLGSSLGVSPALTSSLGSFNSLPITGQFSNIVSSASGVLGGGTLDSLRTLGAGTFPALTNAIPGGFSSALGPIAAGGVFDGGFTGLISQTASGIMGGGDLGNFGQIFNSAQGFVGQANQFVNSGLNLGGIASTFGSVTGGMDSLITGGFSQVSEAFGSLGGDLGNLGNLINMNNLPNLGSPAALVGQLASVGGLVPGVESALRTAGIDTATITNLATGGFANLSDTANKALYTGMTQITGAELAQVKNVLGVTTPGIGNMADLLNPVKILPNSFATLTMPTPDGLRGIYATTAGAVNTNLERFLVDPKAPAYTGDDPIVRARLGLPPTEATV
jgi:hypothetical protein